MKKVLQFVRSMRFGLLLLTAIAVLCVIATVMNVEAIYHNPAFIALFALLCLNLILCSIVRVRSVGAVRRGLCAKAEKSEDAVAVEKDAQPHWLQKHGFKKLADGSYLRHGAGFYGSFVTHAALLMVLVAAFCNFTFADKYDYAFPVGQVKELPDGTRMRVDDFSMENAEGKTEYTSVLSALLPDGTRVEGSVQVNHPMRVGRYKVYQQNYGIAAVIGVKANPDDPEEIVILDSPAFLSLDGEKGIYYIRTYGSVIEDEAGISVFNTAELINPAYDIQVFDGEAHGSELAYPGTTLKAGGVYYTMYAPQCYPGLRVKYQPEWTLWLLYAAFALMVIGLYLCFFHVPVAASADGEHLIRLAGTKDISDWIAQIDDDAEEKAK